MYSLLKFMNQIMTHSFIAYYYLLALPFTSSSYSCTNVNQVVFIRWFEKMLDDFNPYASVFLS